MYRNLHLHSFWIRFQASETEGKVRWWVKIPSDPPFLVVMFEVWQQMTTSKLLTPLTPILTLIWPVWCLPRCPETVLSRRLYDHAATGMNWVYIIAQMNGSVVLERDLKDMFEDVWGLPKRSRGQIKQANAASKDWKMDVICLFLLHVNPALSCWLWLLYNWGSVTPQK